MQSTERPAGGERVLWLHGYSMDSRIWAELWDRLPGWHHIAVDLPGHGLSAPLLPGTDLSLLGRWLGDFAAERDVRHLVGISFGGMVALQVAIERPDLFATLTLGAPALGGGPQSRHAQARNLELARLYAERGSGPWLRRLWMTPPPGIFTGAASRPALWNRLAAIIDDHRWAELSDTRMKALTDTCQLPEQLARITAETLVLVGDEDDHAFKRSAELIRRNIPKCQRIHLERTGHLTLLERAEEVQALLENHIRGGGRAPLQLA